MGRRDVGFTVRDFQDLLELLRQHPEWRQQLWALLAGEELLRLPAEFRAFREETERRFAEIREEVAAARAEADRRFAELAEAQRRTEERVGRLEEAVATLAEAQRRHYEEFAAHRQEFLIHRQEFLAYRAEADRRFAELAEAQRRTEKTVRKLVETTRRMNQRLEHHAADLGELKTMRLEAFYHQRAAFAFHRLVRRASPVSDEERYRILEQAAAAGRITEEEVERALPLDLLVKGFHRREDRPVYLAVEISWLGGTEDVERALERAEIFARALGEEVWPVVGAKELTPSVREMARQLGVWWVQYGQAFHPEEIPEGSG